MNTHSSLLCASLAVLTLASCEIRAALAQDAHLPAKPTSQVTNVSRVELQVLTALRAHPLTAPYPITATWKKGVIVLSGAVGTKQVHDVAVRLAIASGSPIRDDLVIDTGLAHLASLGASAAGIGMSGFATLGTSGPYIYPPPLMGRLDDPFFGFVPPLVSFPPWWRRQVDGQGMVRRGANGAAVAAGQQGGGPGQGGANAPGGPWQPLDVEPVKGQVEITVDASGQVFLRGVVTSEEAAREIENTARSVPGVSHVDSQLQVIPRRAGNENPPPREGDLVEPRRAGGDNPPPPPQPAMEPDEPEQPEGRPAAGRPKPAAPGPAGLDKDELTRRVVSALSRRPLTARLPVKVRSDDGAVTLTGRVPSAYEAMMVYRAAQQTPGVDLVVDRLEFAVPDEDHPNTLVQKARPEDLEPYLVSQIRRHVGDVAHIDRIQAHGDVIDIRGTLGEGQDRDRLLAILRSIPVLRGFRLEPQFAAE
jgi:osmotically-inducible protein OsmY